MHAEADNNSNNNNNKSIQDGKTDFQCLSRASLLSVIKAID